MILVHFMQKKDVVLSQLREQVPLVDADVRIKGRIGKVTHVKKVQDDFYEVQVEFQEVKKRATITRLDDKKKRRR